MLSPQANTCIEQAEVRCADAGTRVAIDMTKCKIRGATSVVKDNEDPECLCAMAMIAAACPLCRIARCLRSRVDHIRMTA